MATSRNSSPTTSQIQPLTRHQSNYCCLFLPVRCRFIAGNTVVLEIATLWWRKPSGTTRTTGAFCRSCILAVSISTLSLCRTNRQALARLRRLTRVCSGVSGLSRIKGNVLVAKVDFFDHHAVPLFHSMKDDLLKGAVTDTSAALASNVALLGGVAESVKSLLAKCEEGGSMPDLDDLFAGLASSSSG